MLVYITKMYIWLTESLFPNIEIFTIDVDVAHRNLILIFFMQINMGTYGSYISRSHFMFLISIHNHFLYLSLTGGWQASLPVPIREEYEYLWVRMQAQQFENKSDTSNFLKVTKDSSAVSRVRGEEK